MYLSEGIIDNFIETIDEADMMEIESLSDEEAYEYLAKLYQLSYGAAPSGTGIYFLKTKFRLDSEENSRRHIPNSLF